MSTIVDQIYIKSVEERLQPSRHHLYKVEVHTAARVHTVLRRYSEFDSFQKKVRTLFGFVPAVPLPPKHRNPFKNTHDDDILLEERRHGLQMYLQCIIEQHRDTIASSMVWFEFLGLLDNGSSSANEKDSLSQPGSLSSSSDAVNIRRSDRTFGRTVDVNNWMDEYREMRNLYQQILAVINYRDSVAASSSVGAGDSVRAGVMIDRNLEAKKLFTSLGIRIKALAESLDAKDSFERLSDGEILRRRDLLDNLRIDRDKISHLVTGTHAHAEERRQLFATSPQVGNRRVFGIPVETDATLQLDNQGILELQTEMVTQQDGHLDNLLETITRQKELGRAIGGELDIQNKALSSLESKLDVTAQRLKIANKAADKL